MCRGCAKSEPGVLASARERVKSTEVKDDARRVREVKVFLQPSEFHH